MKVALGSDHAGFLMKEEIKKHLTEQKLECFDFGTFCENPVDYPDIALPVVEAVRSGSADFGILVCGTGVGMAIAANKYRGIRAALCSDTFTARCSREHNDANILALGARVIGSGLALEIVDIFLNTAFQGGRHQRRVEKIALAERRA
ncbi:MAG: ribose 5-phosphate isomerase B [Dethiobacteria bacterium]|nr:ribose 5-phosphate isomerase B [Bacillota bacterium]HPZ64953.1 ribose 5-phosphate isomerase B [Bacillota bacterium]HQD05219.1 ribose 5-phosphate isomerase B [Bacillota bacterium]